MKFLKRQWLSCLILAVVSIGMYGALQAATINITGSTMNGRTCYADSLTAVGDFDTLELVSFSGTLETIQEVTFQITVTNINTSVDVRGEGSLDGVNWWNLDDTGSDTQYLTDDTSAIRYYGLASVVYIRLVWTAEAGGTDAIIAVIVKAG